jgi:hypothetical protein
LPGAKPLGVKLSQEEPPKRTRRSGHHHSSGHKPRGKRAKRAGRKHKRLHRLAVDPTLVVHRQLSKSFLELASSRAGALDLDTLGR